MIGDNESACIEQKMLRSNRLDRFNLQVQTNLIVPYFNTTTKIIIMVI